MTPSRTFQVVALLALLPAVAPALTPSAADNLVDHLLAQAGRTRGLVALPAVGEGQLARAFAQRSAMMVYAMNPDTASVRVARTLLEPTGHVGTRVYIEKAAPSLIPLAANYADLLVIANCSDASLSSIPLSEIVRTIIPGGRAYVGRAQAEGAGLTAGALQSWLGGLAGASVVTDAQGTWAVITKQPHPRAREWTHNNGGPGNTWNTADSAFTWPPLQQWRQKPYVGQVRLGNTVAGGGRLYSILHEGHAGRVVLRAYRIYNGQMLWRKDLGPFEGWQPAHKGSMMVAADSGLFLINRNAIDFIVESGAVARSIVFDPSARVEVIRIAVDGGTLFALGGDTANFLTRLGELNSGVRWLGTTIKAFPLSGGAALWTHTESGGLIDSRNMGVAGGKVFFIAKNSRVAALNASTGALVWENRTPAVVSAVSSDVYGKSLDEGASGFMCTPTLVIHNQPENTTIVALSAASGALQWSTGINTENPYSKPKVLLADNTLITCSNDQLRQSFNILSGTAVPKFRSFEWGTCGTASASGTMLFSQRELYNLLADQPVTTWSAIKGSCGTPVFVSNGLAIQPRNTDCECPRIRALHVQCAADTFTFDRAAIQSQRLENGPAAADLSVQVTVDSLDWETYRGDVSRSASAFVNVPASPNLIWRAQRQFPYDVSIATCVDTFDALNTPPVTAGTLAWWGGSDGQVRCWDMQAKSERWAFPTGGRIYASPAVAEGCVFAGSMDGYVYCLEAHTGRLVWRFRGAPVERRINWYGQLASQWPVITGVVVNAGRAYFAAGCEEMYGTHVYALDARTGAIVWQNNTTGSIRDKGNPSGFAPNGYMTIARDKLLISSTNGRPGVFALSDGAFQPLQTVYANADNRGCSSVRGRDIGLVLGRALIRGGPYTWSDHSERGRNLDDRTLNPFTNYGIDANGLPTFPQVD